jgi:hypothetical protein
MGQLPLQVLGSNDLGVAKVQGEHLLALPTQAGGTARGLLSIRACRRAHRLLLDGFRP